MQTKAVQLVKEFLATQPERPLVTVLGPTASGKTALAIAIAQEVNGEIVSADSRAIYRELDIGTAKPDADELAAAPHHCISDIEPSYALSVAKYRQRAEAAIDDILARGKIPILAGSHTLLISAIVENYQFPADAAVNLERRAELEAEYDTDGGAEKLWGELKEKDAEAAETIPKENKHHLIRALELAELGKLEEKSTAPRKYQPLLLGLETEREALYERINARVDTMMSAGLLDEVMTLKEKYDRHAPALRGHGYRELLDHLADEKDLDTAVEEIKKDTRHYAKRQMTWFRNCSFAEEVVWLKAE